MVVKFIRYVYTLYYKPEVGVGTPSWDEPELKKTPEMNDSEPDKHPLKI